MSHPKWSSSRCAGYLRYGLSFRDLEELVAERGIEVDHVTLYPVRAAVHAYVDRCSPAVSACGGERWFVDETYVKGLRGLAVPVSGGGPPGARHRRVRVATSGYRLGAYVLDAALTVHGDPSEVITDRAPALANVIEELVPAAMHNTGQYENNRVECDHGRLKARLRPMRGLKTNRTASVVIRGHAFVQNLRRGHYGLALDAMPLFRLATAFDELRLAI